MHVNRHYRCASLLTLRVRCGLTAPMAEQQRAQGGEADTVALEACNLGGPVQCAKSPAERVLDADKATPDDWVPRSPELIRLTGAHAARAAQRARRGRSHPKVATQHKLPSLTLLRTQGDTRSTASRP